jgi:hypothetical protein
MIFFPIKVAWMKLFLQRFKVKSNICKDDFPPPQPMQIMKKSTSILISVYFFYLKDMLIAKLNTKKNSLFKVVMYTQINKLLKDSSLIMKHRNAFKI